MGAGIAGWAVCNLLVVLVPFGRRERWSFWALALGAAVWIVLGAGVAAYHRVWGELAFVSAAAICRQLVRRMGDEIEVESQVAAGSTFTVLLPQGGFRHSAQDPDPTE